MEQIQVNTIYFVIYELLTEDPLLDRYSRSYQYTQIEIIHFYQFNSNPIEKEPKEAIKAGARLTA